MGNILDFIGRVVSEFGLFEGLFLLFFLGAHYAYYKMVQERLAERQMEINRLAEDNRAYRERYLAKWDQQHGYNPKNKTSDQGDLR